MAREKKRTLVEFFVSPDGDDRWSGRRPAVNKGRTDGPFATLERARLAVRRLKGRGDLKQPVRVTLRGGTHFLRKPLVLGPRDSGARAVVHQWRVERPEVPVTYAAHPGEEPIVSGGRRIAGWREERLQGRPVWVADLPEVKRGRWTFRQLWVNGERRLRPRLPRQGEFRVERLINKGNDAMPWRGGNNRFIYRKGDLRADWRNLRQVEIVAMHVWYESRMWVRAVNEKKRLVTLDRKSQGRLIESHIGGIRGAPYYVENVFEALEPGTWYLDAPAGRLYYMPLEGEKMDSAEVIAPVQECLVRIEGDAEKEKFVEAVHFEGLVFSHNEWHPREKRGGWGQAANGVPGAVAAGGARDCSFTRCRFVHLGTYGLALEGGCRDVRIQGNELADLGAGGIKVWHLGPKETEARPQRPPYVHGCRRITVADNHIHHGGLEFLSAVGVLVGRCSGNRILHNHIHHLYYTGISVGWTWGYGDENNAYGNIIEYNHVHDIGQGLLSDMGGIYTLGQAQGTRIRFNLFHGVTCRNYGGWGIYPDEGSTDLLIENNLVYRCNTAGFHQHFGKRNVVENNIFAFGGQAQFQQTRGEEHLTVIFRRNVVYFERGDVISGNEPPGFMQGHYSPANICFERNLYFATRGAVQFLRMPLQEWQAKGFERGSLMADPHFVDATKDDFRLRPESSAFALGFKEFDLSAVGPRPEFRRA